ncbi:unnamed protein product [Clonostachys solani]|uniref:Uncharacterized protein n=1 Tax=Clonostachys solani TaxID=160281 RepID=A0A9N9ZF44_9HYPO|nr:unnamed protein product [Clonostachys solani]
MTKDNNGSYNIHRLIQLVMLICAIYYSYITTILRLYDSSFRDKTKDNVEPLNLEGIRIRKGIFSRWEEAEKLEVQVIEISKMKLREDYPNTLRSMANLALIYRI